VTSIERPDANSGSHATGSAIDVAFWHYSPGGYDYPEAEALLADLLAVAPHINWLVVAEDDHLHAEANPFSPTAGTGRKNRYSGFNLEIPMFRSNKSMRGRLYRDRMLERGDALAEDAAPAAPADNEPSGLSQGTVPPSDTKALAIAMNHADQPGVAAAVHRATAGDPMLAGQAKQLAGVMRAIAPDCLFVVMKNGAEINSSVGNGKKLTPAQCTAVATMVQGFTAPMPVRPYNFLIEPGDVLAFYPTAQVSQANGGPLDIGTPFKWMASFIIIRSTPLVAQPGVIAQVRIQYAPPGPNTFDQVYDAEIGAGAAPTTLSMVHGVIPNTGQARLEPRDLTASALPPAPPVFPRIAITGLPTTVYSAQYRFVIPGDYPADRFSAMLQPT
jgi:hypothetical protein